MPYYDSHVHSRNSHDSSSSVESICRAALKRGLAGVAVTDHVDAGLGGEACFNVINGLKKDIARARDAYGGELEISLGIELGEGHHDVRLAREIASDDGIDFIIGSLHRPRGGVDYYYVDYDHEDLDGLLRGYYDELAEMAEAGFFDVAGHINYQLRYMSAAARERVNAPAYYDRLRPILRDIASGGRGIEINVSSLWRGLDFTLPSEEVVRMFREEGGEAVTTGTDSHDHSHVGDCLDGALKVLSGAGFGKFAFFKKRTPCYHDIF
jgi:histidinol-phosphatase (PHP family)